MTPEVAEYYRAMLLVGIRDKFDAAFDRALETEESLSDLVLSLSTCISDDNQVLSVLHEYTLNYKIDEQVVHDLILEDIRSRYVSGEMTREDVANTLYRIARNLDKYLEEVWCELTSPYYVLECYKDGSITKKDFNKHFDVWFSKEKN